MANPDAVDDGYSTRANEVLTIAASGFLANDTDADGDTVVATAITDGVDHGTLVAFPDGSFTYTPDADFVGTDSFSYSVSDGHGGTDIATVTIQVTNSDPDAVDDGYSTRANEVLTIAASGFLANDTDADGDTVVATAITDGVDHGTLVAFPDGSFTYTPDADFVGTDSFSYSVSDGHGGTDIATVTIEVTNSDPVANADVLSSPLQRNGGAQTIASSLLLANDTDADGDPLAIAWVTAGTGGTVSLNATGDVIFTPTAGFQGQAYFTYAASDGIGASQAARVDLLVGITGTGGNDVLLGTPGKDYLFGLGGNDYIAALGAGDVIYGGLGNDTAIGGSGGDRFVATLNDGNDRYFGLVGVETYDLSETSAPATVHLQNGTATSAQTGSDLLFAIENVIGSSGDDTIRGSGANNRLDGGGGNDLIEAGGGKDMLLGGGGNDRLNGGSGVDWLDGGTDADILTGGQGADVFAFSTALGASNIDTIVDFSVPSDVIQLDTAIFSAIAVGGLAADAFHVGSAAADAEDRIVYNSATGALYYDADGSGSGAAIQFAKLAASLALTQADFVGFEGPVI
jgi:Ca2+-binding RTX toxin-like protein